VIIPFFLSLLTGIPAATSEELLGDVAVSGQGKRYLRHGIAASLPCGKLLAMTFSCLHATRPSLLRSSEGEAIPSPVLTLMRG
jgi:hypothetical protein